MGNIRNLPAVLCVLHVEGKGMAMVSNELTSYTNGVLLRTYCLYFIGVEMTDPCNSEQAHHLSELVVSSSTVPPTKMTIRVYENLVIRC